MTVWKKQPVPNEQNQPQPSVTHAPELPATWDLVIADMRDRDNIGRAKYGTPLQPCNGRDSLVDAYQEVLDLAVYLRNEIEERKRKATPATDSTEGDGVAGAVPPWDQPVEPGKSASNSPVDPPRRPGLSSCFGPYLEDE